MIQYHCFGQRLTEIHDRRNTFIYASLFHVLQVRSRSTFGSGRGNESWAIAGANDPRKTSWLSKSSTKKHHSTPKKDWEGRYSSV